MIVGIISVYLAIAFVWWSVMRAFDCWDKATYKDRVHEKYKPRDDDYRSAYFTWNWDRKRAEAKERYRHEFQNDFDLNAFFDDPKDDK